MKHKKVKKKESANFAPIPCRYCGMPLIFVYEGTENAEIGCLCSECGEYTVVTIHSVERRGNSVNVEKKPFPKNVLNSSSYTIDFGSSNEK